MTFILILLILFLNLNFDNAMYSDKLTFKNNEFTILQFTDLHYGEDKDLDNLTFNLQDKLINEVKPDLVVITGDSVGGWNWDHTQGWFKDKWDRFTFSLLKYKIPYALTLGNHDAEGDLDREQIIDLDKTHNYSLMKYMNQQNNGTSNYYFHVFSSFNHSNISLTVWLFDSMSRGCGDVKNSYGCVTKDQIEWYNHESIKLKNLSSYSLNGIAFMHIPLSNIRSVYNDGLFRGKKMEGFSCPRLDTCLMNNISKTENIQSIFCGHDHDNDFGGFYKSILLKYGRKSGYGNYGPKDRQKGATVIKFQERLNNEGKVDISYNYSIINEDLSIDNQLPFLKREGSKEIFCSYDDGLIVYNNDCLETNNNGELNNYEEFKKNEEFKTILIIMTGILFLIVVIVILYFSRKRNIIYSRIELQEEKK